MPRSWHRVRRGSPLLGAHRVAVRLCHGGTLPVSRAGQRDVGQVGVRCRVQPAEAAHAGRAHAGPTRSSASGTSAPSVDEQLGDARPSAVLGEVLVALGLRRARPPPAAPGRSRPARTGAEQCPRAVAAPGRAQPHQRQVGRRRR